MKKIHGDENGVDIKNEAMQRSYNGVCSCGHNIQIHWHGRNKYYYCAIPFCECDGFRG